MNIEIWQLIVYFLSVFIVLAFGILYSIGSGVGDSSDLFFACLFAIMPYANTAIALGVVVFVLVKLLTHAAQNDRTPS